MQEGSPWILTRISVFWGCFAVGRSDRSFGKKASLGKIDRPPSKVSCWLLSVYVNQVICNSADLRLRCFSVTLPVSLCLRDLAEKVYRQLVYRDAGSAALGKRPNRFGTRLAFRQSIPPPTPPPPHPLLFVDISHFFYRKLQSTLNC